MFPRDIEFYSKEQANHNRFVTFNSGSESNHFSTYCSSTKLREKTFIYVQNVEEAKVRESPIWENSFGKVLCGIIMCRKARLVVKGFHQTSGTIHN